MYRPSDELAADCRCCLQSYSVHCELVEYLSSSYKIFTVNFVLVFL